MEQLGVFVFPPAWDASIVHCMATFGINFAGTHLYTWVERGTVRKSLECIAHEHNAMLPARAWTWTAQSGVECADCDATLPSQVTCLQSIYLLIHTDLVILNLYYFELISSSPWHLYHVRNSVAPRSLWSCRGTFKRTMCRNSKGLSLFLGTMLLKKVHHKYNAHCYSLSRTCNSEFA